MSRIELAVTLLSLGVVSCSGISHIDEADIDQVALDLDACIAGDATCKTSGPVVAAESTVPGDHAFRMDPGGVLEGPLQRPTATARLNALVVGYRVIGENGPARDLDFGLVDDLADPKLAPGLIRVHTPNAGYNVVEMSELDHVPAAKARVHLAVASGSFEIVYVVGRWHY